MKNLFRLSIYILLSSIWSCSDHQMPPGTSCDEFNRRIATCINWRLTSRTVNKVEAIQACSLSMTMMFPGGKFGNQFLFVDRDPEFCSTGNTSGGPYTCDNGTIILKKTVGFFSGPSIGPFTQTLNFLSPTSFLLTYADSKGNAVVETYVATC